MRLIDAEPIIKKLEENNSFTSSRDYDDGYDTGIVAAIIELENATNIDPVHAAGGVYCRECIYKEKSTIKNPKDYWCQLRDSYMDLNGFCNAGRKEEENDA